MPFIGLWLEAPETVLIERTKRRRFDPSDADETVIRKQHSQDIGAIDWHRIDASLSAESVLRDVKTLVGIEIPWPIPCDRIRKGDQ